MFLHVWFELGYRTRVKLSGGPVQPPGLVLYLLWLLPAFLAIKVFKSFFLPHLNCALLNISGLAESINSSLIVDGDESASRVDVVVAAGHIITLPFKENAFIKLQYCSETIQGC